MHVDGMGWYGMTASLPLHQPPYTSMINCPDEEEDGERRALNKEAQDG
jgi:hypothetical protein